MKRPNLEERAATYDRMRSADSSDERKEGRLGLTLAIAAIEIRDAILKQTGCKHKHRGLRTGPDTDVPVCLDCGELL